MVRGESSSGQGKFREFLSSVRENEHFETEINLT